MFFTPCSKLQFVLIDPSASIFPSIPTVPSLSTTESTPSNLPPPAFDSSCMPPISSLIASSNFDVPKNALVLVDLLEEIIDEREIGLEMDNVDVDFASFLQTLVKSSSENNGM